MRFLAFLAIILAVLSAAATPVSAQADLSVNALRIGTHPDKTRIVIDISRKSDFRAFMLQGPPRLVVDLPAFAWKAPMPARVPGSMVGNIRNGALEPGISRIVIDLEGQASLKDAFALPAAPNLSDRIVLDFTKPPAGWNPANERMFGKLSSSGGRAMPAPPAPQPGPAKESGILQLPPQKPQSPATAGQTAPPAKIPASGRKPMVVIDAGHGGQDPGAVSANGMHEKTITLAAAKELKEALEKTGRYRVHLTRSSDKFIKLQDRVKAARQQNGDLFISLHADSIDKANVSGASVYTLSNTASDAQTARLAARENQADLIAGIDLSHEDKEVANILIDLAMRDTMNQSKFFANNFVNQARREGIRLLERPHRYAGFAVLKAPDVPSVLIEIGFMSNRREVDQLSSPAYRRKIISAIVSGIDDYFARAAKNNAN